MIGAIALSIVETVLSQDEKSDLSYVDTLTTCFDSEHAESYFDGMPGLTKEAARYGEKFLAREEWRSLRT